MERRRALFTTEQAAALRTDEAPVGIDVGRGGALLTLGRFVTSDPGSRVMFGTDDVRLGDLDRAGSHAVVSSMVGGGTPRAVHQLLVVLHHGVLGVVAGTSVAGVVGAVDVAVLCPDLRPDCVAGETGGVVRLPTAGD